MVDLSFLTQMDGDHRRRLDIMIWIVFRVYSAQGNWCAPLSLPFWNLLGIRDRGAGCSMIRSSALLCNTPEKRFLLSKDCVDIACRRTGDS